MPIILVALTRIAGATTYDIYPADDLYARLGSLQAGDEVIVHAGTYMTPGYLDYTWTGIGSQPIIIRAADGDRPVIVGTFAQNTLNIHGTNFTFKGFEIKGGSHGLRLSDIDHAVFEDLVIHDIGDVGISCNLSPANCNDLTIRHNEIYNTGQDGGTGEGLYLGCNDGSCLTTASLIENNYIHDMGGTQGDGIEIKTGSYANLVRDNVVVRSKYPGITMYGYSTAGGRNIVERNLVWHATVDAGIQIVGQVIVRNNIVIDTVSYGIFSKPSNGLDPHDTTIIHNTVVNGAVAACLRTSNWSGQANNVVANNAFYCEGGTAMDINGGAPEATITNNVVLGTAPSGATLGVSVAADLGDTMYPPPGSALINAGSSANKADDDFNATARTDGMPDVGAYEVTDATNPGWTITEGFKDVTISPPITGNDDFPTTDPGGDDSGGGGGCCSSTSRPVDRLFALAVLGLVVRRRRRR